MSEGGDAVAALIRAVAAESDALVRGGDWEGPRSAKAALARTVASTLADDERARNVPREVVETLAGALRRNRAILEAQRDALRELTRDLSQRLAEVEADGTYTRSDLLATPPFTAPLLAPPADRAHESGRGDMGEAGHGAGGA